MPISKDDAVKIAQDFLKVGLSSCRVKLNAPFAKRESVGDGFRWSIMFERISPPDVVSCPAEVVVLVDEATGKPEIGYVI